MNSKSKIAFLIIVVITTCLIATLTQTTIAENAMRVSNCSSATIYSTRPIRLIGANISAGSSAATVDLFDVPDGSTASASNRKQHFEIPLNTTIQPDLFNLYIAGNLYVQTSNDEETFLLVP